MKTPSLLPSILATVFFAVLLLVYYILFSRLPIPAPFNGFLFLLLAVFFGAAVYTLIDRIKAQKGDD